MTIKLYLAAIIATGALTACGSSKDAFLNTSRSGFVDKANFDMVGGEAVPNQITIIDTNDVEQTLAVFRVSPGLPVFTDGSEKYQIAASSDGNNYAVLGYNPSGLGFLSGRYFEVTSKPPESGIATYTGSYFGTLWERTNGDVGSVSGNLSLIADFSANEAFGLISGRTTTVGVGYNTVQITDDLGFTGSLESSGNFDVTSGDAETTGFLEGIVHGSGAVGIAQLSHINGAVTTNEELIERSAFSVE